LLQRSSFESDRKFWSGERPVSVVQWVGLLLIFLGVAVVASFNYRAFGVVFAVLVLSIVLGNLWAHRKTHPPNKH
jgi:4-hydroxybenzoate polyprenyltransferase